MPTGIRTADVDLNRIERGRVNESCGPSFAPAGYVAGASLASGRRRARNVCFNRGPPRLTHVSHRWRKVNAVDSVPLIAYVQGLTVGKWTLNGEATTMSTVVEAAAQQRSEMSLNIPPEFERAVLERVQSGAYASTDDVVLAALAALQEAEADEAENELLRREIEIGIHSAENEPLIPGDEVIAYMHAVARGARP